jgi:hypothetical protein
MTKILKFVSTIILFFSLLLTTKAFPKHISGRFMKCEVVKDCYDELFGTMESYNARGKQVICKNGLCRIVSL